MALDKKNIAYKLLKTLYYILTILICLIVFFLLYYIVSSQIHSNDEDYKPYISLYTIVSPSMTPVINVYDVVVNGRVDDPSDIQVGDIITYKSSAANSEGMTITHRVIEVSQLPDGTYEYMTQGDNNKEPDSLYVTYNNVLGKEILVIPYIGKIQFLIANQKGWLIFLLIPIFIYLVKEIFSLIDLFNLRKKVDKVIGTTEDNFIEKKRLEKLANEKRKEQIRKELQSKEHKANALQRSSLEPDNFLERYTETIVNVKENKYSNIIKPSKEITFEELAKKVEQTTKKSETNKIKPKEDKIEILATDELTTKIKEYDDKLSELNKILKKVEKTDTNKVEPKAQEETDNYLKEGKIKVISMVQAKGNKELISLDKPRENLKPNNEVPKENARLKIERPDSEDIKTLRSEKKPNKVSVSKNNLNLNPRSVKKINRTNNKSSNSKSQENKPNSDNKQKNLNLNPNKVKKVNRPNRRKKQPLIVIEKTRRKK